MSITRAQQARQMLKKGSEPIVQGGVDNYLGKQPQVVAPRKWQSGPDKPPTELAYITEAEKKLLLKEDIHGSLKKGPNVGPAGIMSLDSFGDIGGGGSAGVDTSPSGAASGDDRTQFTGATTAGGNVKGRGITDPSLPPGVKSGASDIKTKKDKKKAKKEVNKFLKDTGQKKTFFDTLKKFGLPTQRALYGIFPNNPKTELSFLSGLTQEQVNALNNKELSDLYDAIQDADFSGDLSFEDALGDKYEKLSFDAFKALSQRGVDTNFMDPQGEFGNMDFAEYAARIKGKPGLLFSGDVGNIQTIKNPDGTYSFVKKRDDNGSSQVTDPCKGPNPPAYCFIGGNAPKTPDPIFTPSFRFMNRGGMVEDAPMGGIMDLESTRQTLFLGGVAKGISKGLKSITRGIKKVAKSPIGKAALLGAVGFGIPGTQFGGLFGRASFGGAAKGFFGSKGIGPLISSKFSNMTLPKFITDNMTGLKVAGLSGLGGALLASLENKDDNDFNIEEYYKMAGIDIPENQYRFLAEGGDVEPVAKKTMPLLDMDGQEMDFRQEGGFVPIGRMEKADDVPARLSKNEFVFTADAVRNAGGGDVDKGAEVMYNTMKNLEAGGEVSEETQGLEGARNMFQTSQRLGEVV